jgi:flagellar hook-basal body complex protein FliE
MAIPVDMAISAYNNAAKSASMAPPLGDDNANSGGSSFLNLVKESLSSAIDVSHKSEEISAKALVGQATPNDVVMAINNAQASLQEAKAVRDGMISAYQDILKMPI